MHTRFLIQGDGFVLDKVTGRTYNRSLFILFSDIITFARNYPHCNTYSNSSTICRNRLDNEDIILERLVNYMNTSNYVWVFPSRSEPKYKLFIAIQLVMFNIFYEEARTQKNARHELLIKEERNYLLSLYKSLSEKSHFVSVVRNIFDKDWLIHLGNFVYIVEVDVLS